GVSRPPQKGRPIAMVGLAAAAVIAVALVWLLLPSGSRSSAPAAVQAPTTAAPTATPASVPQVDAASASAAAPSPPPAATATPSDSRPAAAAPQAPAPRPRNAASSGDTATRTAAASIPAPPAMESPVARKPGESSEAWQQRSQAIQTRYAYSKAALDRRDFA